MSGWAIVWSAHGDQHVIPMYDQRNHNANDCWCEPTDDEGILVHHSADGREAFESGARLPS